MSEYNLSHTGAQLDEAISKVENGYILPSGSKSITANGTHDVNAYANAEVNVPVPDEYVEKSLLQSAVQYFDLASNKTGVSSVDSPWYSFTPAFVPKIIVFSQSENSNGNIERVSSSIDTFVMAWWFDENVIDNPRYWAKGGFLRKSSTPGVNVSSNGAGIRYDPDTNKIYFYCSGSAYGLKAGTNSSSAAGGFYTIQYWG